MTSCHLTRNTDKSIHSDTIFRFCYTGDVVSSASGISGLPDAPEPATGSALAPRSDVQRNRQALLKAARELFATGRDVPMYEVARRAGVGQATLYRHFPDRGALVAALAEETLAAFERQARALPDGVEAFTAVLRLAASAIARSGALSEIIEEEEKDKARALPAPGSLLHHLMERLLALIDGPLQQAKAAGAISEDFRRDDVVVLLAMMKGALECAGPGPEERAAVVERALDLALHGVIGGSHPAPMPTSAQPG